MPDDTGEPVVTTVCFLPLHTGCGCIGHPAFPAPSFRANDSCTTRAHRAAGTERVCENSIAPSLSRHHPRMRVIQYPETSVIETRSHRVLDTPLEPVIGLAEGETRWRGMTVCGRERRPRHLRVRPATLLFSTCGRSNPLIRRTFF